MRDFECRARHEAGEFRDVDQDRVLVQVGADWGLFAAIDGMGGGERGELAAEIVAEELQRGCAGQPDEEALRVALLEANRRILDHTRRHQLTRPMGAVLVVAWVPADPERNILVANIGDCRALLFDARGAGPQISVDHSAVSLDRRPEAESMLAGNRHLVTRAVGPTEVHADRLDAWAHVDWVRLRPDQLLLLCTDGISDYLDRGRLSILVERHFEDLAQLDRALFRDAIAMQAERGKGDNLGLVLVRRSAARAAGEANRTPGPTARALARRGLQVAALLALATALGALLWWSGLEPRPIRVDVVDTSVAESVENACNHLIRPRHQCPQRALMLSAAGPIAMGATLRSATLTTYGRVDLRDTAEVLRIEPDATVTLYSAALRGRGPSEVRIGTNATLILRGMSWDARDETLRFVLARGATLSVTEQSEIVASGLALELGEEATLELMDSQLKTGPDQVLIGAVSRSSRVLMRGAVLDLGAPLLANDVDDIANIFILQKGNSLKCRAKGDCFPSQSVQQWFESNGLKTNHRDSPEER